MANSKMLKKLEIRHDPRERSKVSLGTARLKHTLLM